MAIKGDCRGFDGDSVCVMYKEIDRNIGQTTPLLFRAAQQCIFTVYIHARFRQICHWSALLLSLLELLSNFGFLSISTWLVINFI